MGRGWMLRTFVGCCVWILHGLRAAVAVPVTTEGQFGVDTAFPSTAESQVTHALVPENAEMSTAAALLPGTAADAEIAASLADSFLVGGPTSSSFPTGAELSDLVTAANEYSSRSAAGNDTEAGPSPPEQEETQVPTGDPQALTNVTKFLNVSQENEWGLDAPGADAASFSTPEPLFSPNAEPDIAGAAPDTSLGTTPASLLFVDANNNFSVSVTREGAEDLEPAAGTASVPHFLSPSAGGAQPTTRAIEDQAADSPLGLGITVPPSRGLDTATMGVSKEGVTLAADLQSRASAPSLSPDSGAGELLATWQDEQASEAAGVIQGPAGETAVAAEEGPTPLEAGKAGDAIDGGFGEPDLSHPPLGSETVLEAVRNPEETSRLASETELSPDALPGPDRNEQGSSGVDIGSPNSAPSPAASEALAAPTEPDVQSATASLAAMLLPAHTEPLPTGTVAPAELSLHPAPWDTAAGGLLSPVDIPTGSLASLASSSAADSPQPVLNAVAGTLSRAENGAELSVSPNLSAAMSPSLRGSEPQGTAAGASEGAELPSADVPGTSFNPAPDVPSLASLGPASPVPSGLPGVGLGLPAAEGSEAGVAEQALGGGGSAARTEPSLSSAPGSRTAVGMDQLPDAGSPSGPASPDDVVAAPSVLETDGAEPIAEAAPGPDSPSQAPLDSEGGPDLAATLEAESAGDVAGAGNPESPSPDMGTSPPAFSPQQDPVILGELSAGEAGALTDAEVSHPLALGSGAGVATALGEMSLPGPAAPGSAALEPGLGVAAGQDVLPGESPSAPGSPWPAPGAVAGILSGTDDEAEMPASPSLGPVPFSLGGSELQGLVGGAAEGAGLPGANGPGTSFNPALDASSSVSLGPVGPVWPVPRGWPDASLGLPAVKGSEAGVAEQALRGGGGAAGGELPLSSASGSETVAGTDQLRYAGSLSSPASHNDGEAASSILETDGAGPIAEAAPGPDSPSQASLDSEGGPDLAATLEAESAGDVAGAGNPESPSPDMGTSPPAFSPQQDPVILGELSAGEAGALTDAEVSHPLALGSGAGVATALGETSLPGSAALEPGLGVAAGQGDLPGESPSTADFPQPALGAVAGTLSGADDRTETPASPNLSTPMFPSLGGSELQGMPGSTSEGAELPGASGPGAGLNSVLDAHSPSSFSLVGPVSPVPRGWPGAGPGLPAAEGSEAGTAEQVLGAGGSAAGGEPSLSSALGSGTVAGMDQLPDARSLSGPASANDVVAASSVLETARVSYLGGVPSAPGFSQPALGSAQLGAPPATGEADKLAEAVPADGVSAGGQGPAVEGTSSSGAPDGAVRAVEHSAPSSLSVEGSSPLGTAGVTTVGAGLPGASGGADGLNAGSASGPGSSGPEGTPLSAPGIQSGSDLGPSDTKLSQVNVVELPGGEAGVSADHEASLSTSSGDGAGAIVQIAAGVLAPSALASPQQTQTLVPSALDTGIATAGITGLLGSSLLLPGHGLAALPASLGGMGESSVQVPNEKPPSPSNIRSGSSLAVAGTLLASAKALNRPLADAETALPWSPEDETASGLPAPLGEEPPAPMSPNMGLAAPPAPEGLSSGSRFSSPVSASDLRVGPSALEKGDLRAASSNPAGSALLLPPPQPESPGVLPSSAAAEGRGDADSPGELSPRLPSTAVRPGAAALLPPEVPVEPPTQPLLVQGPAGGGSSGLAPIRIAAESTMTKILGPGSAGGSSSVALQPSSGGKAIAGLTNVAAAGSAAAGSSVPAASPGQGAAQGGPPATVHPAVSCSPTAAGPASPALLHGGTKALPGHGANGAAALLPQTSSAALPALPGGPVAPAALLSMTTVAAVPLYGYGARENDREYVERRVDFNSPLFKPETGFPFGKTLRDSLYFTDNGQIVFPASDNDIFPYPKPPPGGFNGREKVPMIAVFWDDADFSRGVGTTFYQEFLTLNSAKPPFIRDVEAKIRRYMKTSYSAVWTLKVTWEKAPARTAQTNTRRTSTYQAVLTTDGFRSYLLILYQDGGMKWDYTQLAATNVLIGYSSGDGIYHNDDLIQRPPAAKYRPDQVRGYNTDLRGLWIYKLESRVGANYRLKCLAWTGRQQEPQTWSRGLPACPCSLQQGQRDPRFRSAREGRLGARLTMLHSASPNQYGAGVRCLYDSRSQFVEGRQERYWRSSRQASPYRDQELKLHDWCCNQAGSAQLCARYSEKRPKMGCDGYQLPSTGRSSEEADSYSAEQEGGEVV
ncbi:mucin-4-like [Dromaius novaehollandiae]